MSTRAFFLFTLLAAILLQGCSQAVKNGEGQKIGDLKKGTFVFEPVAIEMPTRRQALENIGRIMGAE